jgi:D-sedoheptulose 7-phosphate isomerase
MIINPNDVFNDHILVVSALNNLVVPINTLAFRIYECVRNGGKVLWMGNGGSSAECEHLASEFVGRFRINRKALPALSLSSNTAALTAISNDFGFEQVFARQLEAFGTPNDIIIGLTTSGKSENVLSAFAMARKLGIYSVVLTGTHGADLTHQVDMCIVIPSTNTARIQECHLLIGHVLCDMVEQYVIAQGP